MADLDDLITRLERAEGPSRELDAEIHIAVHGWKLMRVGKDYDGGNECEVYTPGGLPIPGFQYPPRGKLHQHYHVPNVRYTENTDDALTAVPPGWTVARISQDDHRLWHVELRQGFQTSYRQVVFSTMDLRGAPRPAIAVSLAALRARSLPPEAG